MTQFLLESLRREINLAEDRPYQGTCEIASGMVWNRGGPSIRVPKEYVAALLANRLKSQTDEQFLHRTEVDDGRSARSYIDLDLLDSDEFWRLDRVFLQAELQHLLEVVLQLTQCRGLRMGTGDPRYGPDVQLCVGVPLDLRGEGLRRSRPGLHLVYPWALLVRRLHAPLCRSGFCLGHPATWHVVLGKVRCGGGGSLDGGLSRARSIQCELIRNPRLQSHRAP